MRAVLDTSVLIGGQSVEGWDAAISVASLAELHFGVLVAAGEEERARRTARLGVVEATFDALGIDAAVARQWGRLNAAVVAHGGQPRRRQVDLVIAATAIVHEAVLLTHDIADLRMIDDLVEIRDPTARPA